MLLLLGVFVYGIYTIKSKNEKASLLLLRADKLTEETVLLRSIKNLRLASKEDLESLERAVLEESEMVDLIETIEHAGRNKGLNTSIVSVSVVVESTGKGKAKPPPPPPGTPKKIELVVESEGPLNGILNFAKVLEGLPHKISINEASLVRGETTWTHKTSLIVQVF